MRGVGRLQLGRSQWPVFFLLLALCWLAYGGNAAHQLLHWDDITYVSANPWVTDPSWAGLGEVFTQARLSNWHPLTSLSYIAEYYFCGQKAACYKATNITLHAVNAFLVYGLSALVLSLALANATAVQRRVKLASLFAGALFAVHPQHAESVIWVAERKDLLCAVFFLLAITYYLRQHAEAQPRRTFLPFLFFALALLSKSMAVTLPAVLVILDFFPLGRFKGASVRTFLRIAVVEKLHFHATALVVVLVTVLTQHVDTLHQPTLYERMVTSASALWHYAATFVWPFGLSPFYPSEIVEERRGLQAFALVAGAVLAIFASAGVWGRRAVAFLAYFLVTVAPVVGIVKIGEHAFADRYTYLPMVGFYLLAGQAIVAFPLRRLANRFALGGVAAALLLLLCLRTQEYKDVWRSDLALWQHVSARYPSLSTTVHNNLGNSYFALGHFRRAVREYELAMAINPRHGAVYGNLGLSLEKLGEVESALENYALQVKINPRNVQAHIQAGRAFDRHGNNEIALRYFAAALALVPGDPDAIFGLGKALLIRGDVQGSIATLKLVPPDSTPALNAQLLLAQAYLRVDQRRALQVLDQVELRYGASSEVERIRAKAGRAPPQ